MLFHVCIIINVNININKNIHVSTTWLIGYNHRLATDLLATKINKSILWESSDYMEFIVKSIVLYYYLWIAFPTSFIGKIYSKHTPTHTCIGGFFREMAGDHFPAHHRLTGTFSGTMEMMYVDRTLVLFSRFIIERGAALYTSLSI